MALRTPWPETSAIWVSVISTISAWAAMGAARAASEAKAVNFMLDMWQNSSE